MQECKSPRRSASRLVIQEKSEIQTFLFSFLIFKSPQHTSYSSASLNPQLCVGCPQHSDLSWLSFLTLLATPGGLLIGMSGPVWRAADQACHLPRGPSAPTFTDISSSMGPNLVHGLYSWTYHLSLVPSQPLSCLSQQQEKRCCLFFHPHLFSQKVCRFHISTCFPSVSTFLLYLQTVLVLRTPVALVTASASYGGAIGKEPTCQCRRHKRCGFDPWVRKISWRREWLPTPAFLPGESHGQRSLADNSPWAHTELGMTEGLSMHTQPPI